MSLSRYAQEAKTYWTHRRPKEAATMTDQDFEDIATKILDTALELETPELLRAATLTDLHERIAISNQARAKAIELATHEWIYSQPAEPEILQAEQEEEEEEEEALLPNALALLHLELRLMELEADPQPHNQAEIAWLREQIAQFPQ